MCIRDSFYIAQQFFRRRISLFLQQRIGIGLRAGIQAVSYTHLDVYKRQLFFLVEEHTPGGYRAATDCVCLCKINIAKLTGVAYFFHIL